MTEDQDTALKHLCKLYELRAWIKSKPVNYIQHYAFVQYIVTKIQVYNVILAFALHFSFLISETRNKIESHPILTERFNLKPEQRKWHNDIENEV